MPHTIDTTDKLHQMQKIYRMGCINLQNGNAKKYLLFVSLFSCGVVFGVFLNQYGFLFESIKVDVKLSVYDEHTKAEQPYASHTNNGTFKVPNIVHFIWFGKDKKMTFLNYVSIYSAHKIQRPDTIMFHCDNLPVGKWWERLWQTVPLKIMYQEAPKEVHGQKLLHMYHRGDIAKIEILMKFGGIYLDYDVIMIQSMDPLRKYDATLGKEKPPKFIAGIIVARPGAPFLRLWHESYKNNYRPFDWDYNCARVTYQLYLKRPDLLHVEPYRLTTPDWKDRHLLWNEVINWRQLYVIHVMQHLSWAEFDPDNIKELNSTFGEVVRFIYYGSPKMIK